MVHCPLVEQVWEVLHLQVIVIITILMFLVTHPIVLLVNFLGHLWVVRILCRFIIKQVCRMRQYDHCSKCSYTAMENLEIEQMVHYMEIHHKIMP